MRAIRVHEFGGPEVMRLEDVPDPKADRGQVLVRVHAAGVNPVDAYIRSGMYPRKPTLPYTPGSDAAGEVAATGDGVTLFKKGDRVYTSATVTGAYAELALADEARVHPLPANVSFAQGAAIGVPYATAYRALFQRAQGMPGESVLVHGATGGVGIAAVQLARAAGFVVFGTGGTEEGRRLASEQGAHHVLDHHTPDYLEKIVDMTGGRGVDIVLEMLANENLGRDLGVLAMHGRVVVIGSRGTVEIDPRAGMGREASIHCMSLFNASPKQLASIHAAIVAGLENGSLRPVIDEEIDLADARRAHEEVMKSGSHGKIILNCL